MARWIYLNCFACDSRIEDSGEADPDPTDQMVDLAATAEDIIIVSLDTEDEGIAGKIVDGSRGDLIFNEDGTFDYIPEPGAEPGIDTFTVEYPVEGGGAPVVETLLFETLEDGTVQSRDGENTTDNLSLGPDVAGYEFGDSSTSDDPDLGEVFDLSKMTINFIPEGSYIIGQYVFGSEKYNEFVGTNFKDSAGIFVNNENVSLTPDGQPLSIATINGGNAAIDTAASNPDLYIDNDIDDTGAPYQTQMDGFTKTLTFVAKEILGEVNTIEDVGIQVMIRGF